MGVKNKGSAELIQKIAIADIEFFKGVRGILLRDKEIKIKAFEQIQNKRATLHEVNYHPSAYRADIRILCNALSEETKKALRGLNPSIYYGSTLVDLEMAIHEENIYESMMPPAEARFNKFLCRLSDFIQRHCPEEVEQPEVLYQRITAGFTQSKTEPVLLSEIWSPLGYGWLFQGSSYIVAGSYTNEQMKLLIMEDFDKDRKRFERLKQKFSPHGEEDLVEYKRHRILESVRIEVWRRDGGKCARCGCRENLEYDHIVPISRGGGSTARNIELLCEKCNRSKGNRIE